MKHKINLQEAFVLHYRPYRDTSVLLDLLTKDYGRISAVGRGVRGARSKLKGLLQPFMPILATWSGKNDLVSLNTAEANGGAYVLLGDALLSGLYINELLLKLLHRFDPHPEIYQAYHKVLEGLMNKEGELPLREFEIILLKVLGYGIEMTHEAHSDTPLHANKQYYYTAEHGFTALALSQEITQPEWVFSGKSILEIAACNWEDKVTLQDAKRLMRLSFAPLLNHRALNSRKLFGSIVNETRS